MFLLKKIFAFNPFLSQYFIIFFTILLLFKVISTLDGLFSWASWLFCVSTLTWFITKRFAIRLDDEILTSFKRAVLITGCDSGIGNALAHKMNEHGFRVYATVLDPLSAGAQRLLSHARFQGKTKVLKMDVRSDEEVRVTSELIQKELIQNGEQLWALVNNAGVTTFGPSDWGSVNTYRNVFDVNTLGAVRVTQTFLPLLRQSKGRIVNIVSSSGQLTMHYNVVYSMANRAIISFSDALRRENKKWGIKVSTVEPVCYMTPMNSASNYELELDKQWAETPEDIKEEYGQQCYESIRKNISKLMLFKLGDEMDEVMDQMVDAIRAPKPHMNYVVVPENSWSQELALFMLKWIPNEWTDLLYYFLERKIAKPIELSDNE